MSDRSLAVERTSLAWQRTGLTHMAAGAAVLRLLPATPLRPALAAVMIVVGAVTTVGGRRLDPHHPHRGWVASLAVLTTLWALAAVALIFS